jgi:hypothetical protein
LIVHAASGPLEIHPVSSALAPKNSGIVSGGVTGTVVPDGEGGQDLTITEQFARSMSLHDALARDNLLCYEMNGDPLPPEHGFPVRLIAPGWYGVANVKWLTRIEVTDHRFAGRFMARDYVSIREEQRGGQTVWTFATVSHDRLKSAPARSRAAAISTRSRVQPGALRLRQSRSESTTGSMAECVAVPPYEPRQEVQRLCLAVLDVRLRHPALGGTPHHVARVRHRGECPAGADGSVRREPPDVLGEQRVRHSSSGDPVGQRSPFPHGAQQSSPGLLWP